MNEREKSVLRYISALENADLQTVSDIWGQAENDSDLMQALLEIHQEMKGHTTMIPFPNSRQMNTHSVRWLRVAVALLIAAGVILLALSLSTADSPVRSTPLQQGDEIITADNADQLEIMQTLGKGHISGAIGSPDGQMLALYGTSGFWLLDGDNLQAEPTFMDVGQDVVAAEFTEDSSQIIYDTRAGIYALTVATGGSELLIPDEVQSIGEFDYHDGLIAFTESRDIAGIWDIERGRPLHYFQTYSLWNSDVTFSEDGSYMAYAALAQDSDQSGQFTQQIMVIDVDSGKTIHTLSGFDGQLHDILFDGTQVVAHASNKLFTWDLNESSTINDTPIMTYKPVGVIQNESPRGTSERITLQPNSRLVVAVRITGQMDIFDFTNNTVVASIAGQWNTPFLYNNASAKDNLLAVSSREAIEIYNLSDGSLYRTLDNFGNPWAIRFARDEPVLAVVGDRLEYDDNANVVLWNYETDITTEITEVAYVFDVVFGSDNETVYYVDQDSNLKSYERSTESYAQLWEMPADPQQYFREMAVSPDGTEIALANWGVINLYDIERAEVVNTVTGHPYQIMEMDYSPDGAWLVSLDSFGTLIFRDTETWNEIAYLSNLPGRALAVSQDGKLVATAENSISIVDTTTYEVIAELETPSRLLSFTFSEDGTRLIGASDNGKIYIWGVPSGE